MISGDLGVAGERLGTGDAAKIAEEREVRLSAGDETELILVEVDLA